MDSRAIFIKLANSLEKEIERLRSARKDVHLFSGIKVGNFAGYYYYRFEIPDDILLRSIERATFTFGEQQPISLIGNIISVENQFLTVALPKDFGTYLPETKCAWNFEEEHKPVIELLKNVDTKSPVPSLLFNPADSKNRHIVGFDVFGTSNTPPEQLNTVKKIFQNRVTFLWGPISSGKTQILALTAANYIKSGRKVLFVAPTNDNVDSTLLRTVQIGEQLGIRMDKFAVRVDLPSPMAFESISPYSFENQVEKMKDEKRKAFQERITLLDTYWNIKIKQILNEDFYLKIKEKRNRLAELRKLIDQTAKEITELNQTIAELENASLIERVKKGISKEDISNAHEQLTKQQQLNKRYLAMQQAVSNEITTLELDAPVSQAEQKTFKETIKRIDELGGLEKVTKAVEDFTSVDERALLQSKLFIATGISTALLDPAIKNQNFDLVIIDEAQHINLPTIAALALLARDKLVIAGDPFQVEPEVISAEDLQTDPLLKSDIFLYVAQTTELHQLFEWSEKNSNWSIFLKSQFTTTPKLSLFMSSLLFDEKINVFTSPQAQGKIYFIDTSTLRSYCKQFAGKKKILPYNELHTKQVIECVKHALMQPNRKSYNIGIIHPFVGPTLYTKLQLRLQGISNIEVGTPQSFCNRRKDAIIFDTTMAGVDYTMHSIDDKKVGEHTIARLFNTVFSCVGQDLYIIADMSHFKSIYENRLFTKILMLLQMEADEQQPVFTDSIKRFDSIDPREREDIYMLSHESIKETSPNVLLQATTKNEDYIDPELKLQMKLLAQKQQIRESKSATLSNNIVERETYTAVKRVLGWRTDVNLVSQFVGGDLLFRNSLETEISIRELPLEICENEKHFKQIMEKWNLLIYEMSGGSKTDLSFFASKSSTGKVRHDIRNLHSFYSSDVEAAIEEGKHKIAVEVSHIFQGLIGKSKPGSPTEWSTAYLNFLTRLEAYLSWVSEQIRK